MEGCIVYMILQRVEIKGFKSFANRTTIKFVDGITCVVGPNGCGKSNITDAIRWVLGEQSTKTLRAKRMQDVIFGGTQHRDMTNYAEVTLYFTNDDDKEMSIKRVLHRSGDSAYSIDGVECRLKDIKELIMDTGIGISGYSIVGQGNIEDILSDSKFDRRKIFEEASGISYLHSKRDEAVKRLNKVDENITRLNDIYTDISDRIVPLEKESKKAIEYLGIKDQIKRIELHFAYHDSNKYESKLVELKKKLHAIEIEMHEKVSKREEIIDMKNEIDQSISTFSNESHALLEVQRDKIARKDELYVEVSVNEERISQLKAKSSELTKRTEENKHNISKLEAQEETLSEDINAINFEKGQLKKSIETLDIDIAKIKGSIEMIGVSKEKIDDKRRNAIIRIENSKTTLENLNSQIEHVNTLLDEISSSERVTNEELMTFRDKTKENENELAMYKENAHQVSSEIETLHTDLRNRKDKRIEIDKIIINKNEMLAKFTTEKEFISRHSIGSAKQEEIVSYIKNSNHAKDYIGLLRDLIKVPKKYENAMEVAFGRSLNNIVMRTEASVRDIVKHIRTKKIGRATFIPVDFIRDFKIKKVSDSRIIAHAIDLLDFDPTHDKVLRFILQNTLVAKSLEDAVAFSTDSDYRGKIVTLDGDIVQVRGKITGGKSSKSKDSIFSIINRREKIDDDIAKITSDIKERHKELRMIELDVDRIKKSLSDKQDLLRVINEDITKKEKQAVEYSVKIKSLEDKRLELQESISRINHQKTSIEEHIEEAHIDIVKTENLIKSLEKDMTNTKRDVDENELAKLNNELIERGLKNARIEEELIFKNKELATISASKNHEIAMLDEHIDELKKLNDEIDLLVSTNDHKNEEYSSLLISIKEIKEKVADYENSVFKSRERIKKFDKDFYELDKWINDKRIILRDIEIDIAKNEDRKNSIVNYIWEKYNLAILQAKDYAELEEDATKKDLQSLKSKLRKLEPVNLNSPKEYKELKERYDFFTNQLNDLSNSKSDIQSTIKSLEQKMREDFKETFQQIKDNYSVIFNKLFRGGSADIYLDDESDVLESDIVIMASPPGKKLKHLSLLSGGEKALTAIALLFAVLKSKPAPFYILDEIEAALDDINIYRFATFLEDFSKRSKFILITHRKPTMEFASALYGVSMEEKGVSKMVSLELN